MDALKLQAARRALDYVESGMTIGLGSGTTATLFTRELAQRLRGGEITGIIGIPTSNEVAAVAEKLGIPLSTLEDHSTLDLTVDGADEVDPDLNLIKGGGGALLREKIVAQSSLREIIVIDDSKLSPQLGMSWHVPVEVVPFGWRTHLSYLSHLGADVHVRLTGDGSAFRTDENNLILDCRFGPISDPEVLDQSIRRRAGIIETGLFIGLAHEVIVASQKGTKVLTRTPQ